MYTNGFHAEDRGEDVGQRRLGRGTRGDGRSILRADLAGCHRCRVGPRCGGCSRRNRVGLGRGLFGHQLRDVESGRLVGAEFGSLLGRVCDRRQRTEEGVGVFARSRGGDGLGIARDTEEQPLGAWIGADGREQGEVCLFVYFEVESSIPVKPASSAKGW